MIFFSSAAIVVSIFLIIACILMIKEKNKKIKLIIVYLVSSILLLIFGVLGYFKFFDYWQIICIAVMLVDMTILFIFIKVDEHKDKKYKKLRSKKINKEKVLVDENDNIVSKNNTQNIKK